MCAFKADHDFILCTLENKGGLYQNLPISATEIPQLAYACDRTDYEKYHIDRQPFINVLTGDITSKKFLFLGFSFTDPNLDYILSRVRIAYDESQRMHHCILRNIQIQDREDQAEFEF